jgi:hypothetical protein
MIPPLFVPLRTEWFRQFESGDKTVEYRAYGPRWNERTCFVGRKVTLSHGYSGKRLSAEVVAIDILNRPNAPEAAQNIFPNAEKIIAIYMDDTVNAIVAGAHPTLWKVNLE